MTRTIHAAALAMVTLLASPAGAQQTVRVATGDIEMNSAEGRAELASRARRAAIDACGTRSAVDRHSGEKIRSCREEVARKIVRAATEQRLAAR